MEKRFTSDNEAPVRLDLILAGVFESMSRSKIGDLIKKGHVRVNGATASKPGVLIKEASEIVVDLPESKGPEGIIPNADLPCTVLYEDANIVIINKAPGVLSHPTAAPESLATSVVSWLAAHLGGLPGDGLRPGIVHRLDQWTGGCLVLAKHEQALRFYAEAFEHRAVTKEYLALVEGILLHPKGTIDAPIGRNSLKRVAMDVRADGRQATTSYTVLSTGTLDGRPVSLLRLRLHTGRTHQIRVHLASIGHPMVGDPTYGAKIRPEELHGQWLQAADLTVPGMEGGEIHAHAPLTPEFLQVLEKAGISWQNA